MLERFVRLKMPIYEIDSHGCMAVWLYGCMAVWLYGCMAVFCFILLAFVVMIKFIYAQK
jgi:hypothetical protein